MSERTRTRLTRLRRFLSLLLTLVVLSSSMVLLLVYPASRPMIEFLHEVIALSALATLVVVTWDVCEERPDPRDEP